MKFRFFLHIATMGLSFLGLATTASAQPPFPAPLFLLSYPQSDVQTCSSDHSVHPPLDYRPSVDASGTRVVYERTIYDCDQKAYPLDTDGDNLSFLFVSDLRFQHGSPAGDAALTAPVLLYKQSAARADWCPVSSATSDGLISFSTDAGIFVVDPDLPGSLRRLASTKGSFYPAWYPYCQHLAVKRVDVVNGGPGAIQIDARTGATVRNLSGENTWSGFVSISQANAQLVVFAGQPVGATPYNENMNYIYLADETQNPPKVMPLDPRVPKSATFDPNYQGRAPTFSPDGQWVAFESFRPASCVKSPANQATYALFIQRTNGLTPARQVTDCMYNAQHARWLPQAPGTNKTVLIAAAIQPGTSPAAFGVAAFDITAFLKP